VSTLNRDTARELFSDYLENELAADTRDRLETYLSQDAEARKELQDLRKTLESLGRLRGTVLAPAGFARKVERRIRRRSRGRFFGQAAMARLPFEWFSFLIILVLLTLYFLLMVRGRRDPVLSPGQQPATGSSSQQIRIRPAEPNFPSPTRGGTPQSRK